MATVTAERIAMPVSEFAVALEEVSGKRLSIPRLYSLVNQKRIRAVRETGPSGRYMLTAILCSEVERVGELIRCGLPLPVISEGLADVR